MALALSNLKTLEIVKPDYNMGFIRFLVYGESGVGKTWLVGSAAEVPELCPVLICDADMGLMTLANKDIAVTPIRSLSDVENVCRYVRSHPGEYKTVILDGLTSLYNLIMQLRMAAPNRSKNEDPYVPGQADWLHATFQLRTVIQLFKMAPVNFLATALVDQRQNEFSGMQVTRPGLSNKLASEVGAEFDMVGYLYTKTKVKETNRILQLTPGAGRVAKSRSIYPFPAAIEEPTMRILYGRSIKGLSMEELGGAEGDVELELTSDTVSNNN